MPERTGIIGERGYKIGVILVFEILNIEHIDRYLGEANDEFEGVNKRTEESKQKLDEILSADAEQEDIEAHKNNIILYRIAESSQVRAAERQKEDVDFCEKFFVALQVGVPPEDIIKVLRLGKRNTDGAPPRPILIQLGTVLGMSRI